MPGRRLSHSAWLEHCSLPVAGPPLHVVSEVLGHASITITKMSTAICWRCRRSAAESMSKALFGA